MRVDASGIHSICKTSSKKGADSAVHVWYRNRHVPLGKVAHCLAATLATLASDPAVAQLAMQPGSGTVNALLQLVSTSDDDAFAGMHMPLSNP